MTSAPTTSDRRSSTPSAAPAGARPTGAPALASNSDDKKPWRSSPSPDVTVAQCLAFGAFVVFVAMAVFKESVISTADYGELKRLCIFLIAALLPSDALIRFGRARFMAGQRAQEKGEQSAGDEEGGAGKARDFPSQMRPATLGQVLAFAAFLVVCFAAAVDLFSASEFGDVAETASYLIAALLPSEATVRFGRALWLKRVPTETISADALKKI